MFLCSRLLPEGEAQDPDYWENDCSCGSSGLLGIRKCHKSQERDYSQPTFQTPEAQMHFFLLLCSRKTSSKLGAHLSSRLKFDISMIYPAFELPRMLPNPQFATFLTGSSALLKNVHILADKPFNSGNSACLLDFFLESV